MEAQWKVSYSHQLSHYYSSKGIYIPHRWKTQYWELSCGSQWTVLAAACSRNSINLPDVMASTRKIAIHEYTFFSPLWNAEVIILHFVFNDANRADKYCQPTSSETEIAWQTARRNAYSIISNKSTFRNKAKRNSSYRVKGCWKWVEK